MTCHDVGNLIQRGDAHLTISYNFITPHYYTSSNSFDIVCLCVSVCRLPISRPNGQAYGLEFWHGGPVEGYLGQLYRSRS